jgi:hypothetical protein
MPEPATTLMQLDFHDAFNHQFKAGITAIRHISDEAAGPNAQAARAAFVSRMEKKWRDGHNWSSVSAVLDRAERIPAASRLYRFIQHWMIFL